METTWQVGCFVSHDDSGFKLWTSMLWSAFPLTRKRPFLQVCKNSRSRCKYTSSVWTQTETLAISTHQSSYSAIHVPVKHPLHNMCLEKKYQTIAGQKELGSGRTFDSDNEIVVLTTIYLSIQTQKTLDRSAPIIVFSTTGCVQICIATSHAEPLIWASVIPGLLDALLQINQD